MWVDLVFKFIPLVIAIVLHEVAHGYTALLLGDKTAKGQKRLSLNPLKHIDPFGTFLLPLLLWVAHAGFIIGWAKPVPVDFSRIKHPRIGIVLVSAAGIITNIWMAVVSALVMLLIPFVHDPYTQMLLNLFFLNMVVYNIVIAVFNIIPIPPLDGSKILFGWINKPWAIKYINSGKLGLATLVILVFVLPEIGRALGLNWNLFRSYLIGTTRFLTSLLV